MKTLEEFNAERERFYESMRKLDEPQRNGIHCPECGKELWDTDPTITLTSCPPKKSIHCPECGYRGYRLA